MTTVSMKLEDLHLILLSTASRRGDGSVLPIAETIRASREQIEFAIAGLLKAGLLQERDGAVAGATAFAENIPRTENGGPETDADFCACTPIFWGLCPQPRKWAPARLRIYGQNIVISIMAANRP